MTQPNKNTHYKVKNVNGTSKSPYCNLPSKFKSWLDYWHKYAHSTRKYCCVIGCKNMAVVGAHVIIDDKRVNNKWMIVPFCKTHNNPNQTEEMYIDSRVQLIPCNP